MNAATFRFHLKHRFITGETKYSASHELHNEVIIEFPDGYWGEKAIPQWIELEFALHDFDGMGPKVTDRSGIAADDDPSLRPDAKAPVCQGCSEPDWHLSLRAVVSTTDKTRAIMVLCEGCVEIAEGADPVTGSYGAAAAEWVTLRDQPKGALGGKCNRRACDNENALWFNRSSRAHYCEKCAMILNDANRAGAKRLFGGELCIVVEGPQP